MTRNEIFNVTVKNLTKNIKEKCEESLGDQDQYYHFLNSLQKEVETLKLTKNDLENWKSLIILMLEENVIQSFDNQIEVLMITLYLRDLGFSIDDIPLSLTDKTLLDVILNAKERPRYVSNTSFEKLLILSKKFIRNKYNFFSLDEKEDLSKFEKEYYDVFLKLFNYNLKSREFKVFLKKRILEDYNDRLSSQLKTVRFLGFVYFIMITSESSKSNQMKILKEVINEVSVDFESLYPFTILVEKYTEDFFNIDNPYVKEFYNNYYKVKEAKLDERFDRLTSNEKIKLHNNYYEENKNQNIYMFLKRKILTTFVIAEQNMDLLNEHIFNFIDEPLK